jgi:hypothetical protein
MSGRFYQATPAAVNSALLQRMQAVLGVERVLESPLFAQQERKARGFFAHRLVVLEAQLAVFSQCEARVHPRARVAAALLVDAFVADCRVLEDYQRQARAALQGTQGSASRSIRASSPSPESSASPFHSSFSGQQHWHDELAAITEIISAAKALRVALRGVKKSPSLEVASSEQWGEKREQVSV